MSTETDKSVIYAHLRAEAAAAHEAIRAIWDAALSSDATTIQGAMRLDQVVAEATRLLPPELRTPEMAPVDPGRTTRKMEDVLKRVRARKEPRKDEFDDILG